MWGDDAFVAEAIDYLKLDWASLLATRIMLTFWVIWQSISVTLPTQVASVHNRKKEALLGNFETRVVSVCGVFKEVCPSALQETYANHEKISVLSRWRDVQATLQLLSDSDRMTQINVAERLPPHYEQYDSVWWLMTSHEEMMQYAVLCSMHLFAIHVPKP